MNKILFSSTYVVLISVLCILFTPSAQANTDITVYTDISKNDLKQRIEDLNSEVDLRYSDEVHTIINSYIKKYRKGAERLLGLSEQFFPLYEAEFGKQGLPQELKYLSVIESGLKPNAISTSGAAGLWQFMKGTGKLYGLRINDAVDERRDPIRSTQAASQYLKDLYAQFGDWTLALAAYNCGPGNVRKSLRRSQEEDFWSMKGRGYLPKETRRYIPKYVAMSYMMNYSHAHDLRAEYMNAASNLSTVKVYEYTTFSDITKITGIDRATLSELNPAYLKKYIPKSSKGYYLTLPQADLYYYLSQVGGFENLLDLGYDTSTLRGRYMLYGAMKNKVEEFASLNAQTTQSLEVFSMAQSPLKQPRRIPSEMIIPVKISQVSRRTYQLMPHETLTDVSKKENIRLSKLIELNDIDLETPLRQGAILRLD